MRVTLGLTWHIELDMGTFSFDWALTTIDALYLSPRMTLTLCPILGMSTLRATAPAFTRLAGWSLDSAGVTLRSSGPVRDV